MHKPFGHEFGEGAGLEPLVEDLPQGTADFLRSHAVEADEEGAAVVAVVEERMLLAKAVAVQEDLFGAGEAVNSCRVVSDSDQKRIAASGINWGSLGALVTR